MERMPWFKCYPDAWISKTRKLSPDARAIYFDCLCLLYQTEAPISQDDKWMAHYLHVSPRLWRAVRDRLVAGGYLVFTDAGLTDDRAEEEIEKRAKQSRTNREISVNRERNKRENCEKMNKNNETPARNEHYTKTIEERREKKEEKKEHTDIQLVAAREPEGRPDLKAAFNGSTEAMLADVQAFMGPIADRQNALNWLSGTLAAFGASRTVQAWTIVTSKKASGGIVANPLAFWAKTARGLSDASAPKQPVDRSGMEFIPPMYGKPGYWAPKREAAQ